PDDAPAAAVKRHGSLHPAVSDALLQQHRGDGAGRDVLQFVVKRVAHWQPSLNYAGSMPDFSSRRRSQTTKGIEARTIQALPTTWPARNSSEPKASNKNTIESTTSPTKLEATPATTSRRRANGV